MATSIIRYKKKYIDLIDSQLFISLYFFKKSLDVEKLSLWFKNYLKDIITLMIDMKPVGWAYLDLEENFDTSDKRKYFINLLSKCIIILNKRELKIIDHLEINKILNLSGDEMWGNNNFVKLDVVINLLNDIILLLDDEVNISHIRLNIYEKSPYKNKVRK